VSKDAVYRRFSDLKSLLLAALSERAMPSLSDRAPIRSALTDYVAAIFDYFTRGDGYANLRVHLDGPKHPDILAAYRSDVVEPALQHDSAVLRRAQEVGELGPNVDCDAVIVAIGGACMLLALAKGSGQFIDDVGYDHASPEVMPQLNAIVEQVLHGDGSARSAAEA
jgi:AcrR family transcriptional regulator